MSYRKYSKSLNRDGISLPGHDTCLHGHVNGLLDITKVYMDKVHVSLDMVKQLLGLGQCFSGHEHCAPDIAR
jgi:hypothetical protein